MNIILLTIVITCVPSSIVVSGTPVVLESNQPLEPRSNASAIVLSSSLPDEIMLKNGKVINGVILRQVANYVVYLDALGEEQMEPVGFIKHVRKAGALKTISLAEALASAGGDHPNQRPDGGAETRSAVVILLLDHAAPAFDADTKACYESAFSQIEKFSPTTIIVGVHGVDLSVEAASWVSAQLQGLNNDVDVRVLLGRTSVTSFLLFAHADKTHWLQGGMVSPSQLDPATIALISNSAPAGVMGSAIKSLGSGGNVKVDSLGRLVGNDNADGTVGIDADTARSIGLCHGTAPGLKKADAQSLLSAGANWRFKEIRIQDAVRRLEKSRKDARKQVEAAQRESGEIKAAAAAIRSTASVFDRFYRTYDVESVWRKDRTWKKTENDKRQQSARLQTEVRSAYLALKNAQKSLNNILNILPDDTAEKPGLKSCSDQAKAAIRSLRLYESGIQRNNIEKYESGRVMAMNISIGGC